MALLRAKHSELPPDAVVLSEEEAVGYHTKILMNWKDLQDVFAFKYGPFILGGGTLLTGMYLNNFYRSKFKLLHYGRFSSYLPVCAVPAAITVLLHTHLVVRDLVLHKKNHCPLCIEMRASAMQSLTGCVLPLVLAPVTCLPLVHQYGTFNLPSVVHQPLKLWKLLINITSPMKNIIFGIFVGQALFASAVTYFEARSIFIVTQKLTEIEYEAEHMT